MLAQELARVEVAGRVLANSVASVSSDLAVLAHTPAAKLYSTAPGPSEKQRLLELFVTFSNEKRIYDQVRYLDATGMEIVRVNFGANGAVPVADEALQLKGERSFFRDSFKLADGEVYVSPLDLNVEHGVIETPYKPMLRLGTPVFDRSGQKRGVVVLNVLGQKLLDEFRGSMGEAGALLLLNRDGYFLRSPEAAEEWGFMLGHGETFATRYPDEWRRILSDRAGSLQTERGQFTFRTVFPLLASHRSSNGSALPSGQSEHELSAQDSFWVVVSHLSGDEVPRVSLARYPAVALGYGLGLVGLFVLLAYLANVINSRRVLRRAIDENERHLREMTEALGVGVFVLDPQGRLTYANPEAVRMLGWPAEELVGHDAHERFHLHAEGAPSQSCPMNQVLRSGRSYRSESEVFLRADGTRLPVEVSCHPMRREDGSVGLVTAFQDISDRKRQEEGVRQLAYSDVLTGLPNRRLLLDLLTQALAQAEHHRRALAVMFLDLDNFKRINDTLGHDSGDELIRVVATRLQQNIRRGDTVSRLGGDEFVVLLSEIAHPRDASIVAEKMIASLKEPITIGTHHLEVTTSVGIAVFPIDATDDAAELVKKADAAMYAAKAAGRNTYRFHGGDPSSHGASLTGSPRVP